VRGRILAHPTALASGVIISGFPADDLYAPVGAALRGGQKMTSHVDPTEQLVVEILVRDAARAKAFYAQLGFEVLDDRGSFVVLAWEGHQLFLDERRGMARPELPAANVRVMVPDVERYWALAQEMGARVVEPIGDRDYGLRDFTIADPDSFGVRFGAER
jgi:catechol 2,3-dioxygenase-like lactoylglutathione lyase family enzyme